MLTKGSIAAGYLLVLFKKAIETSINDIGYEERKISFCQHSNCSSDY